MSEDLVKRLRSGIACSDRLIILGGKVHDPICLESADHIDAQAARIAALEAEVERLWKALMWIDTFSPEDTAAAERKFGLDIARAALAETEGRGE